MPRVRDRESRLIEDGAASTKPAAILADIARLGLSLA
jgi:hypothetical protein